MLTNTTASLRQTSRITIEMEVDFHGDSPAEMKRSWQEFSSGELLDRPTGHPGMLNLHYALAVDALRSAKRGELIGRY